VFVEASQAAQGNDGLGRYAADAAQITADIDERDMAQVFAIVVAFSGRKINAHAIVQ
jgi:hypothetical protein